MCAPEVIPLANGVTLGETLLPRQDEEPTRQNCCMRRSRRCCFAGGALSGCCGCALMTMAIMGAMFIADPSRFLPADCPAQLLPPKPDAPGNVHADAKATSVTSVTFKWDPPNGTSVLRYEVSSDKMGNDTVTTEVSCLTPFPNCTIDGLQPSQTVAVRIRAVSNSKSQATSESTSPVSATTLPKAAPDAPTAVAKSWVGVTAAALSWTPPPPSSSSLDTTRYAVEYARQDGSAACSAASTRWTSAPTTGELPTAATRHLTDLTQCTAYCARVLATNSEGSSAWSAPVAFTTSKVGATAPDAPSNLNATQVTSEGASLTWDAPKDTSCSGITRYEIRTQGGGANQTFGTAAVGKMLTSLLGATHYLVAVRAYNDRGPSEWSDQIAITTRPAQVPPAPSPRSRMIPRQ